MKGNKIAVDVKLEPFRKLWANKGAMAGGRYASKRPTRKIGVVTDRSFLADPKKPIQCRLIDSNRIRWAGMDELFSDAVGASVPMLGELVHVKFYQQDYRFRMEESYR